MQVVSPEWLEFKTAFISLMDQWSRDAENIIIPDFNTNDFSMQIEGHKVFPVFIKNGQVMRLEYNFSVYNLQIRQLCFSRLVKTYRIEITVK
jgi:hypothetical protein